MSETVDQPSRLGEVDSAVLALRGLTGPSVELHTAFAGALRWSGVPEVYAPPYFWAPRSRPGDDDRLQAARADAERWADERLVWRQPWWRNDLVLDSNEYERRMRAWERRQELWKPVRPNRHICLPLFAAYAHDVAGLSTRWAIGYAVGLKGTTDPRYDHSDHALPRFKGAAKIVERGRQIAHELGAWPWAEHDDGAIPQDWWMDNAMHEALRSASASLGLEAGRCPYPPSSRNVCVPLLPL